MCETEGRLIVFDGIDGSGTTTQMRKAYEWLAGELQLRVMASSEPDPDSPVGRIIKQILRGEIERLENPIEFQRLYALDRLLDIVCKIRPTLARGEIYLLDRYMLSTYAYGVASMSNWDLIALNKMHEGVLGSFMVVPDHTVVIDVPAEVAIARIKKSGRKMEYFENKVFQDRVRTTYINLVTPRCAASIDAGPCSVINGDRPEKEVFEEIQTILIPVLGL